MPKAKAGDLVSIFTEDIRVMGMIALIRRSGVIVKYAPSAMYGERWETVGRLPINNTSMSLDEPEYLILHVPGE